MLWTILIGFLVGVFARWVKPGTQAHGWMMTTLVGIGGAVLATFIGQHLGWYGPGDKAGFLASVGGAVLVLVGYEALRRPRVVREDKPPAER